MKCYAMTLTGIETKLQINPNPDNGTIHCCGSWFYPSLNSRIKCLLTITISWSVNRPNLPMTKSLSTVDSLLNLINEVFLSPFSLVGSSLTSNSSSHFTCVVMNETVMSESVSTNIRAGLFFTPVRSVNGNGIKTMSPLITCTLLLGRPLNINPLLSPKT